MRKYCLAIGMLLATSIIAQTTLIYKWTDSSGNVHFTDKPQPGAEEIKLPAAQTYSSPQTKNTSPSNGQAQQSTEEKPNHYENISIVQPSDQETIRNTQGTISVILDIKPKLMPGDNVQMIFDDSLVGQPEATTVIALQDVTRGSHTLTAQVMDSQGNILTKSAMITIYMMPPRVGMGNKHP